MIKQEVDRLQSYTYIEDTLKLFLSSLYYTKLIDPINYIYISLNKKLIPLNLNLKEKNNKDEKIVKVLLDYIQLFSKNCAYYTSIPSAVQEKTVKTGGNKGLTSMGNIVKINRLNWIV